MSMAVQAKKGGTREIVEGLLSEADVRVDGERPHDIKVLDERFFRSIIEEGSLAFGETYMQGWWDSEAIDELVSRLLKHQLDERAKKSPRLLLYAAGSRVLNRCSRSRAFEVGERHYDLGNDLYSAMLDSRMVYSCGYWQGAENLEEAQERKLDLICRKLDLKPGQRVLDIGCGWGSFAKYAAEHYGVEVVGITISREQLELASALCHGLPVELRLQDYRDLNEKFDHIVSVGMFEHVGYKNYRTYMEVARHCLKDDGLFLLHTIGNNISCTSIDPWIDKYVFPNAVIPSMRQISDAIEDLFVLEDWHNLGPDYDKTLMAWHRNFERAWPELGKKYGEDFYRMWRYYLLSCAGVFRSRELQVWQLLMSKDGIQGGLDAVR